MKVREDRSDGAATSASECGRLSAPGAWIEMREEELIHRVIDRVGFEEDVANFSEAFV